MRNNYRKKKFPKEYNNNGYSRKRKREDEDYENRKRKKRKINSQDEKLKRLDAWKKKLKQGEIQKNVKQFEEFKKKDKIQVINLQKSSQYGVKKEKDYSQNVFQFYDKKDEKKKKVKKEEEQEEEEDSLDSFFKGIDSELKNIQKRTEIKNQTVITFEDLIKKKNEKEIKNEEDEEKFHELFIKTMNEDVKKEDGLFEHEESFVEESLLGYTEEDESYKVKSTKKDLKPVNHDEVDYPIFRKNFYIPSKQILSFTDEEMKVETDKMGKVVIKGNNVPRPILLWKQCGIDDITLDTLKNLGYRKPFAIQSYGIPCIMSGRNVIGIAPTGSGKTLAFLLPMVRHILDQPPLKEGDGPIGLIIGPTRELVHQIHNELRKFTKPLNLRTACVFGGGNMSDQIAMLKNGVHVIVCTAGRMIDLLCANRGRVTNLRRVTYVVLDEADRMFDFGFGPQITRVVKNVRPDKQLVLFSATFPKPLEALARQILKENSVEIIVGGRSVANKRITQYVEVKTESEKFLRLLALLGIWYGQGKILIFVKKKEDTGLLYKDLYASGYQALTLHSAMDQVDREETLRNFKRKGSAVLIGTSLVARGIDVKDIELVINYDVPNHYEDYVHQVGRTARGEKEGTSYTFITPEQESFSPELIKALQKSENKVPKDLIELHSKYLQKIKDGIIKKKHILYGFTGSGFAFNEDEDGGDQITEQKRQQKSLGLDAEGNPITEEAYYNNKKKGLSTKEKAKIVSKITQKDKKNSKVSSVSQAKAFAATLTIQANFEQLSGGKKSDYSEEIEINDYPQKARWKVTRSNSDELYQITESTCCQVTTKGKYFPPNTNVKFGERKLYLLIEGKNQNDVGNCKMRLLQLLETSQNQAYSDKRLHRLGKYQIF